MSVHEDSRQGNCSWSVVINTPLACPPPGHGGDDKTIPANDTSCNRTTAAGTYVLPSFAKSSSEVSVRMLGSAFGGMIGILSCFFSLLSLSLSLSLSPYSSLTILAIATR